MFSSNESEDDDLRKFFNKRRYRMMKIRAESMVKVSSFKAGDGHPVSIAVTPVQPGSEKSKHFVDNKAIIKFLESFQSHCDSVTSYLPDKKWEKNLFYHVELTVVRGDQTNVGGRLVKPLGWKKNCDC